MITSNANRIATKQPNECDYFLLDLSSILCLFQDTYSKLFEFYEICFLKGEWRIKDCFLKVCYHY